MATSAGTAGIDPAGLFIRFEPNTPQAQQVAAIRSVHGTLSTSYPDNLDLVSLGQGMGVDRASRVLATNPWVVYASADKTIHSQAAAYPNDPLLSQEWGLNNPYDVDIDAPEAWGITTGNLSTIVAVLDTGVDLTNPDLASHLWTNPNLAADAVAGYPGDVHGWNFVSNNANVQDDDTSDGHGTHVSSLIGATGNNGYGIAGVSWNVRIMPIKFLDANGDGSTSRAVSAIYYAVNHGARVINASWGGVDYSQPLYDAINYANAHNVVFVTAAGNDGTNNDLVPSYPASFHLPNMLSVAAVDQTGQVPSFSNFGAQTVDVAAPGVNILGEVSTAVSPSGFEVLSGTSMATAFVSGVAALVASAHPEYSASQIVQTIDATAKPLPALSGKVISGGIVDAYRALTGATSTATTSASSTAGATLTPGATSDADVHATILSSDEYFQEAGGTNAGFVASLYVDTLDRAADLGGLASWTSALDAGSVTRFAVARAFLTSTEGRATEVAGWYQTDLGRSTSIDALKADPGLLGWVSLLASGASDDAVRATILATPEALIHHGATPPTVVQALYTDLAGRAADPGGLGYWSGRLWAGQAPLSVIRAFQSTAEAKATKVADWYLEDLGRTSTLDALKASADVQAYASLLSSS